MTQVGRDVVVAPVSAHRGAPRAVPGAVRDHPARGHLSPTRHTLLKPCELHLHMRPQWLQRLPSHKQGNSRSLPTPTVHFRL